MKRAALGVQMHSGWGVLVAVSENPVEILERRRIVTADPKIPGAIQPYHFASQLEPAEQRKHLEHCASSSSSLAATAIAELLTEVVARKYRIVGTAVLLASGRSLPALEKILAAHPLIHTAEGEFFRQAVIRACEELQIPVTAIRVRDLDEQVKVAFGKTATQLQSSIASMGSKIGPPWTKDHKTSTLAAALILHSD
ncbi:MAG: hypothetical protein ABSC65_10410 [Acidobacteriaceae bacterium]|jgi:hypothetical protein